MKLKTLLILVLFALPIFACSQATAPQPQLSPEASSTSLSRTGEFVVTSPEGGESYSIQSAVWNGERLSVLGEKMEMSLIFPAPALQGELSLDAKNETRRSPNFLVYPKSEPKPAHENYKTHRIDSGKLKFVSITGEGPWEVVAEVELSGVDGQLEGRIKMRVLKELTH